jgi:hypothetical protein
MFKNPLKITSWALFVVMLGSMVTYIFRLPEPFLWAYRGLILIILFVNLKKLVSIKEVDKAGLYLTIILIVWLLFGFVRATFYAENYYVWKSVIIALFMSLFYIVILISTNIEVIKRYYGLYWYFFLPLVIFSMLFERTPLVLNYVPFSILMLFFVLVPKKKKWFLFGIVVLFYLANSQRNDLIKILVASCIGLSISYFYHFIPKWSINLAHFIFLITPFILLQLAVSGTFNVFKMDEYISGEYVEEHTNSEGEEVEEDLMGDTRTFIYQNVFATMETYDAWIMGRSPAFGDEGVDDYWGIDETTGVKGRFGNEVGIMDILLWYGVIGVVIYFLIYVRASYIAIYRSRNRFAKAIGLYVAFLWMWAFVWEKPLFETFYMMDLILIGLCFSTRFRQLTDAEMEYWVKGIFNYSLVKK